MFALPVVFKVVLSSCHEGLCKPCVRSQAIRLDALADVLAATAVADVPQDFRVVFCIWK